MARPWATARSSRSTASSARTSGSRVVAIALDPATGLPLPSSDLESGASTAPNMMDFVTGWDDNRQDHGRATAVAFGADGRLYVGDDTARRDLLGRARRPHAALSRGEFGCRVRPGRRDAVARDGGVHVERDVSGVAARRGEGGDDLAHLEGLADPPHPLVLDPLGQPRGAAADEDDARRPASRDAGGRPHPTRRARWARDR